MGSRGLSSTGAKVKPKGWKLNSKNARLNIYKRELEKESVTSDEAESKVKVLESKIQVLEKALENALNK